MKGHMNTQMGEVLIDTDVIAKYAGSVAVECFGIVGMASVNMKDGLVKLLKKDSLTHGISVELNDNRITLDFHVIVVYGVNISSVADNLISTVKYQVEEFTGMEIEKINIYVAVSYTHLDVYKRQRAFRPSAGLPEKQLSRALFRLIHHQGADGFSPTGTGN